MPLPTTWVRSRDVAPPLAIRGGVGAAVAERAHVVGQRVEPDVDDLLRISGHRDAPVAHARPWAGHADVAHRSGEEAQHLVAPRFGLDAQPTARDQLDEPVAVARQAEEPVLLLDPDERNIVLRAIPVGERVGVVERLTSGAVPPDVLAAIEIAGVPAPSPDLLDRGPVARVGAGAYEVVVGDAERVAERPEPTRVVGHERFDRLARGHRGLHVLGRVLVGAGQEAHGSAPGPGVAREHVGLHELERVAEMGRPVDERDRGREIETVGHRSLLARPPQRGKAEADGSRVQRDPGGVRVRTPWRGPSFVRTRGCSQTPGYRRDAGARSDFSIAGAVRLPELPRAAIPRNDSCRRARRGKRP